MNSTLTGVSRGEVRVQFLPVTFEFKGGEFAVKVTKSPSTVLNFEHSDLNRLHAHKADLRLGLRLYVTLATSSIGVSPECSTREAIA